MAEQELSGGAAATAVIAIFSILLVLDLGVLIYCFIKRTYLPFRYWNLPSMYITYFSMLMTFIGSVYAYGYTSIYKEWAVCAVTLGWMGMALGMLLFIGLFQYRVFKFFCIFVRKEQASNLYFMVAVTYIAFLSTLFAALSFALPTSSGIEYDPDADYCVMQNPLYYTGMTFAIIQILIIIFLLFKIRRAQSCFYEFRKYAIALGLGIVAGTIALALRGASKPSNQVGMGIAIIAIVCLWQQLYFFLILGRPVYGCLRQHVRYQDEFVGDIDEHGLAEVYELACRYPLGKITTMSDAGRSRNVSNRGSMDSVSTSYTGNIPGPGDVYRNDDDGQNGEEFQYRYSPSPSLHENGSISPHYQVPIAPPPPSQAPPVPQAPPPPPAPNRPSRPDSPTLSSHPL